MLLPSAAIAVCLAALLEFTVGEPPQRIHPVAWLGAAVAPFDRRWDHPIVVGLVAAAVLPLAFATVAFFAVTGVHTVTQNQVVAGAVAGGVLFTTSSYRMLLTEADGVVLATETDLTAARERLPALVGRDPERLSAAQIRSAALESAAENLADGLVAPLLAFMIVAPVSLAGAAGAAAWVKGVNTLDSMLGYRSKAVGTPAARLDDIVMWLPARVSAVLLAAVALSPDPLLRARRWAGAPPSPNSGWPMGTVAAAVGVQLTKPDVYELNPIASLPDTETARRGLQVVGRAGLLAYGVAVTAGVVVWLF